MHPVNLCYVCGNVRLHCVPNRLTDMRAQCRAAPSEERFSTLRILCRLVFLLSTRAVVSRCNVRGSTLGMLVPCVWLRIIPCITCRLTCLFRDFKKNVLLDTLLYSMGWLRLS